MQCAGEMTSNQSTATTPHVSNERVPETSQEAADLHLSMEDRAASGRAARALVPRSSHGEWQPAANRPDPVKLLEEQAADRVPELVPLRYSRMLVSPFTFYRGAAYLRLPTWRPHPEPA
jgi:hypothetical protein